MAHASQRGRSLPTAGALAVGALGWLAGTAQASHPITAPPTPPAVVLGSNLQGTPQNLFGRTLADFESYPYFLYAYSKAYGGPAQPAPQSAVGPGALLDPFAKASASATAEYEFPLVPVDGEITSFTVKGATEVSNVPGPNGSGDIRLGIDQPLANGQLKVVSTSNPSAELPDTVGTYTFSIGPPATGFAMPVHTGEVLSLDTPGGSYAIWAQQPGAEIETNLGHGGSEQSPGVVWTGTPHRDVELLMRVTIEPALSIVDLNALEKVLREALVREHRAVAVPTRKVLAQLRSAAPFLKHAAQLIAGAQSAGALSAQSASSLSFYVDGALADALGARSVGRRPKPAALVSSAIADSQTAVSDGITARKLAQQVP